MGFVLILLVLAFDSVLQTGNYQIKQVLPRLIVAALLINFSLVFCGVIIDFSQVLAHYFYEAAKGTNEAGLSGQLAGALNIASVYKEPIDNWGDKLRAEDGQNGSIVANILFGSAIMLVAAFSLAAAAIFFIGRIVTLWLLMIFAPIAWMSMIVPNAPEIGGYWSKWWGKFLKWSFFAPIYMFFIYLAIMIASSGPMDFTSSEPAALIQGDLMKSISGFLSDGFGKMLQYIAIIMILVGGLKYAAEAGATGSSTVMGLGKKATGWAKKKVSDSFKHTLYDPAKSGAQSAAQSAYNRSGAWAAKTFAGALGADSKWGGRLRAKSLQMTQRETERRAHGVDSERENQRRGQKESNQAYTKLLGTMAETDLINEVNKAGGIRKLIATRMANEKGMLNKCSTADAEKAIQNLRDFGQEKEAKSLEEVRFDAIADETKRREAIRRAKESGSLDKAGKVVISNPAAMNSLQEELSPAEFNETFKKWGKATKQAAEEAMVKGFTDAFSDPNEIKKRENFASCTSKIGEAFKSPSTGNISHFDIGNYVQKMTPTQMGSTHGDDDLRLIGDHIAEGQVRSIRNELSQKQKNQIRKGDNGAAPYFTNNPAWN